MGRKFNPEFSVQRYVGQKFGIYTVISYSHHLTNKHGWRGEAYVNVRCECGTLNKVSIQQLRKGITKSCGCLKRRKAAAYEHQRHLNYVLRQHLFGAKDRNISWNLTEDASFRLFESPCYYCKGMNSREHIVYPYKKEPRTEIIKLNGIDRVNNLIGYEEGNCVACCHTCNQAKLDGTFLEFEARVKGLSERFQTIKDLLTNYPVDVTPN